LRGFALKTGIKYCGGCNPLYDRVKFINSLKEIYKHIVCFESAIEGVLYDVVLIVCGCERCCASSDKLLSKYKKICITKEKDFLDVCRLMDEIIQLIRSESIELGS
jgi:hypothetical protein